MNSRGLLAFLAAGVVAAGVAVSVAPTAGAVTGATVTCWTGQSRYTCNADPTDFFDETIGKITWQVNGAVLQLTRNLPTTGSRLCTPGTTVTAKVTFVDQYGRATATDTVTCAA
ncbi:hypothetical protein [Actinosynnema sp. NPDC020468]|uniref:hypothetical protein n=1 Tax=Actinosynnema sp. NPDC020468 TaxID=3154488 RepID=UPI0033D0CB2A